MKRLIIISLMALSACGPTREQLAQAKAAVLIQRLQASGIMRQLAPQELEQLKGYLAAQFLSDIGDLR